AWRAALLAELDHFAAIAPGRALESVFFGGGTPSLMPPATVGALLDRAARHWTPAPDLEITLEANPTSVEAANFAAYAGAGVNRVSLGVQALNDADLAALGRRHSVGEAKDAIALAARHFPRYSFDLIYARPGQGVAGWKAELREAIALAGDHLSAYQLTIEKGTPFFALHRDGALRLPDEDTAAGLYETTQEILDAAGMPAYEISNHARSGGECRHNLAYWRSRDYAGIGPGAHGRITNTAGLTAYRQIAAPEGWLASVTARGHGTQAADPVSREEAVIEALMMGLRLTEGLAEADFRRRTGRNFAEAFDRQKLKRLIEGGFVTRSATHLTATARGRKVLNAVLAEMLA
ncbi:MAG: coproporphyrinogen III oxidase, partial [Alphaproteobacteria bacterium]|nr:coproporphyrinogen III oxidase [Alphaproteobacteria bacterium]